ncbi:MAG: protein BatD [Ferruginibacter sp.]|nr:protein BatD [Chitinophagaceae bacterium]
MKKVTAILVSILLAAGATAQIRFKTIVPQQAVVAGESFQVQFIIEDGKKTTPVNPPVFNNFRYVTGPNIYSGSVSTANGIKPLQNAVYTLEAVKPGKFIIPGATITVNGRVIRSNNAVVEVISKEEAFMKFNREKGANASAYFLRPGEDPYGKINQNLFVKVMVDKRTCFVGEPVLATFKLYSRLESKSDIVKNPGFYGFTVYDMVNLADKQVIPENVNGKTFDVHTIRKVQLYPLQAGLFTVDAMEVKNKVEFSRSAITKKTEQEITEGVLGNNDDDTPGAGTTTFETDIKTAPVTIRVKPVPEKNKPPGFNGAAGNFIIFSSAEKNSLKKDEEGFFEITISGKGNFIQLTAPSVQWPAGIEGFDPVVKDTFDRSKIPLAGARTFRYPFVASTPGTYIIPAVQFSFLNTDSGGYKIVTAPAVSVSISNEKSVNTPVSVNPGEKGKGGNKYWIIVVAALAFCGIGLYWLKRKGKPGQPVISTNTVKTILSVENALAPVYQQLHEKDRIFYAALYHSVWEFFNSRFDLSGSEIKKEALLSRLSSKGINKKISAQLLDILEECEVGMFTNVSPGRDKSELLGQTKQVLEEIYPLINPATLL